MGHFVKAQASFSGFLSLFSVIQRPREKSPSGKSFKTTPSVRDHMHFGWQLRHRRAGNRTAMLQPYAKVPIEFPPVPKNTSKDKVRYMDVPARNGNVGMSANHTQQRL